MAAAAELGVEVGHLRIHAGVLVVFGVHREGDREARSRVVGTRMLEAERVAGLVDQGGEAVEAIAELEVARRRGADPDVALEAGRVAA